MKMIPLTQDKFAIVDDEDYEYLSQWKWYAAKRRNTYYAERKMRINGKRVTVAMHQIILGKKLGYQIDHINGNGLDNRRQNLRHVTVRQNRLNSHIPKTSRYPGVHWHKRDKKWQTLIRINGKPKYLGQFTNEYEAFMAYQAAVRQLEGGR